MRFTKYFILLSSLLWMVACTDYEGTSSTDRRPYVKLYETPDTIGSSAIRIEWSGNDAESIDLIYRYILTTDTTIKNKDVLNVFKNKSLWQETDKNYAKIAIPYGKKNADVVYEHLDSVYVDKLDTMLYMDKMVFSKIFIYAEDQKGNRSDIDSKVFIRMNRRPTIPIMESTRLNITTNTTHTNMEDETERLLQPNVSTTWQPFNFKWKSEDPDAVVSTEGASVILEYSWSLYKLDISGNNIQKVDSSGWDITIDGSGNIDIDSSSIEGWSANYTSTDFDKILYYSCDSVNKYEFRVYAKDDANAISKSYGSIRFTGFVPEMDLPILLIDDTRDDLYVTQSGGVVVGNKEGNPKGEVVNQMYDDLLNYAGYQKGSNDIKKRYDVFDVAVDGDTNSDKKVDTLPSLRNLAKYKMIIIHSEDRSRKIGIDYAEGVEDITSYADELMSYLNIGGKLLIIGASAIISQQEISGKLNKISDNSFGVNYKTFLSKYLGLYSYTKDAGFTSSATSTDYDNYDFVGVTAYEYDVDEDQKLVGMPKLNVERVRDAWKYNGNFGNYTLRDSGTVFQGVMEFQPSQDAEIIFKYRSIWDLEKLDYNSNYSYEILNGDTIKHSLKRMNPDSETGADRVVHRSGAVGVRYEFPDPENKSFKTAILGFPLYFLDNSNEEVSKNFKALLNWFDIEK